MSEDFVKAAESKDIAPSSMKAVDVAGEKVCIINIEGNYYAIGNVCTHVGGPLDEGTLRSPDSSRLDCFCCCSTCLLCGISCLHNDSRLSKVQIFNRLIPNLLLLKELILAKIFQY